MKLFFVSGSLIILALNSCGGSGGGSGTGVFSSETVIASPFVSTVGTSSMLLKGSPRTSAATFADRKTAIQDLLNETNASNCKFTIDLTVGGNANCYGPQVNRAQTVGALPSGWSSTSQLPGGDVGMWNETNGPDNEACAAAQITSVVEFTSSRAHFANLMGATLYCFANNTSSVGFPAAVGESITLNSSQQSALGFSDGAKVLDVSSAKISKIEDGSGNEGMRYETEGTVTEGAKVYTFKSVVQHYELAGTLYKGRVSYYIQEPGAENAGNCPSTDGIKNKTYAGHQTYEKVSASELVMELDSGTFCGLTDPLDATAFTVNPGEVYSPINEPEGWADNWNYGLFRFDPRSDEATFMDGKYMYAWQAGHGDSHTRVFNAELESGVSRTGTAYFGFGPPVQDGEGAANSDRGKIQGMICAWLEGSHTPQAFVQRQTLELDTDKWISVTSNIKYAPVNACEYNPATITIAYDAPSGVFSNDVLIASPPPNQAATRDLFTLNPDGSGFHQSFDSFPAKPNF
jgi:hypothetical protein